MAGLVPAISYGARLPAEYAKAPTWTLGNDTPIRDREISRIALTRR
jgi:hypothetical protein